MNSHCKSLLWKIIDCGLTYCPLKGNICHPIFQSQGCGSRDTFHIPEPWNGDIEHAPILFVSINPGFTPNELYPNLSDHYWVQQALTGFVFDRGKVEDFFENRFNNYYVRWSTSQGKSHFSVRLTNRSNNDIPYKNVHGYWNYIQSISDYLLHRSTTPGLDYALTELVHCKSQAANDISEACFDVCMNKHFQEVLNVATNLQYLIVIGKATKLHVAKFLHHDNPDKYTWYSTNLNGKDVMVLYADHNAGGGTVKKFAEL